MRLTKVTIRNFRSFRSKGAEPSAIIDLSSGVNYFVGPNNVGKSNLLRAVALALDPRANFDPKVDCPSGLSKGTAVTLEFHTGPNPSSAVKRLPKQTEAHEAMFEGFTEPSLASEGIIRFHVEPYETGGMYQACLTRDPEAPLATGTVFDRKRTSSIGMARVCAGHYDLTREGKIAFVAWLRKHGAAETFEPWRPVLDYLRRLIAEAPMKAK